MNPNDAALKREVQFFAGLAPSNPDREGDFHMPAEYVNKNAFRIIVNPNTQITEAHYDNNRYIELGTGAWPGAGGH
jgi:hypothetical protein